MLHEFFEANPGRATMRTVSTAPIAGFASLFSLSEPPESRARLLASSMLRGGALRSLAAAAGLMTALGVSPAFAQCYSTGTSLAGDCVVGVAPGGLNATVMGFFAAGTGQNSTAYGAASRANGTNATATGVGAHATGASATATGEASEAIGTSATATGQLSFAFGEQATATGQSANAIGTNATAPGQT